MRTRVLFGALLATGMWLATVLYPSSALAITSFSKKHNITCSGCHVAFPTLNEFGRTYKKNGYRIGNSTETAPRMIADDLVLNHEFPFTARVIGRPYDKKTSGATWKLAPAHEAEFMMGGNPHPDLSGWIELEAEDEHNWEPLLEEAMVGFHPSPMFNIQAGYANIFFSDPYDTLTNGGRRMTVARKSALNYTVGSATQRLRDPLQQVNVNGQVSRMYYLAGVATNTGGAEGNERDKDYLARVAVDLMAGTSVGALYYGGSDLIGPPLSPFTNDFRRAGADLRHDSALTGVSVSALNLWSRDENPTGTDAPVGLVTGYVEAFRPFTVGRRQVVPLARYNWGSSDDDQVLAESLRAYTLQVAYYPYANLKAFAEYTAAESGQSNNNDNRVTLQFDVVF